MPRPPLARIDTRSPVEWRHQLNRGLAAWWLGPPGCWGGGTFRDLVCRRPLSLTNGPTWSPDPGGFGGLTFSAASSQYAEVASPAVSNIPATFSCWFRINTSTAGAAQRLVSVNVGGADASVLSLYVLADGSNNLTAYAQQYGAGLSGAAQSVTVITRGVWYHVAGVFRGDADRGVFVNGQAEATNTTAVGSVSGLTLTQVGRLNFSTPIQYLDGAVSDVRVYTRALSAAEVAALYDQGRRSHPDTLRRWTPRAYLFGAAATLDPRTADLSATQDGQTLSAAGAASVAAAASATQAGQTLSAAGAVAVAGAASVAQAGDSLAAAASVAVGGAASLAQDAHALSAAGAAAVAGSAALTQDGQSLAGTGAVTATGAAAHTLAGDTLAAAGAVTVGGAGVATQEAHSLSAAAAVAVGGSATLTQASDTLAATGATLVGGAGVIAQAGQQLAAVGTVLVTASASLTQASHTLTAAGGSGGPPSPRVSAGAWARADRSATWGRASGADAGTWAPAVYTGTWGV